MVRELFNRHPELFDEPLEAADFRGQGESDEELVAHYSGSALVDEKLYFLKDPAVRTCAWLIEQLESRGYEVMVGNAGRTLKVVEVPDDVQWYLFEAEDGSESIHEKHRVWR